jgi:hypothetical protein
VRASDPDLVLVEAMLAPPPLEDCRRSLEYWEQRRRALPLYRRAARREAAEMAARWEERLLAARRLRFEGTLWGRLIGALGLSGIWAVRFTKGRLLAFGWGLVPRRVKLVAGAVVGTWVLVLVVFTAALAHLLS